MGKHKRKLKRRIKRSRKPFAPNPNRQDIHHLLWVGKIWDKNHYSKLLRNHWYLKVAIPRDTLHHAIHQEVKSIHAPSEANCRYALNVITDLERRGALSPDHPIYARLELLLCIFDYIEPETVRGLRAVLRVVDEFYGRPEG